MIKMANKITLAGRVVFYILAALFVFFFNQSLVLPLAISVLLSGCLGVAFARADYQQPDNKWWMLESIIDIGLAVFLFVGFWVDNQYEWTVLCFAFRSIFIGSFAFVYAFQIIMSSNRINYSDFIQRTAVSCLWLIVGFLLMISQLTGKLPIEIILKLLAAVMVIYVLYLLRSVYRVAQS
jgi:hypothetical protein